MGIKTKLGLALATTAVGASLVGAGTFALFTSEATNKGNTFTAGTLTIEDVTEGKLASQALNFDNLAPGDEGDLTLTVKNSGSLDAWVKLDDAKSTGTGDLFSGATPLKLTLDSDVEKVAAGGTATFTIHYKLPLEADNTYQGKTGTFDVVVDAVQVRNNDNGNGPVSWQ